MDPLGTVGGGFAFDFDGEFDNVELCVVDMNMPDGIEIEPVECPCLNDPLDATGCAITECEPSNRATPQDFEMTMKYVCAYVPSCGIKRPVTITAPDGCQKVFDAFITNYTPDTLSAEGNDTATASLTWKVCSAVTTIP